MFYPLEGGGDEDKSSSFTRSKSINDEYGLVFDINEDEFLDFEGSDDDEKKFSPKKEVKKKAKKEDKPAKKAVSSDNKITKSEKKEEKVQVEPVKKPISESPQRPVKKSPIKEVKDSSKSEMVGAETKNGGEPPAKETQKKKEAPRKVGFPAVKYTIEYCRIPRT